MISKNRCLEHIVSASITMKIIVPCFRSSDNFWIDISNLVQPLQIQIRGTWSRDGHYEVASCGMCIKAEADVKRWTIGTQFAILQYSILIFNRNVASSENLTTLFKNSGTGWSTFRCHLSENYSPFLSNGRYNNSRES
jgi:hypothetical protein